MGQALSQVPPSKPVDRKCHATGFAKNWVPNVFSRHRKGESAVEERRIDHEQAAEVEDELAAAKAEKTEEQAIAKSKEVRPDEPPEQEPPLSVAKLRERDEGKTEVEWVTEAEKRGRASIRNAQEVSAQAEELNHRLKDFRLQRQTGLLRQSVTMLLRDASRNGREPFQRISQDRRNLEAAWARFRDGKGPEEHCITALEKLRGHTSEAQTAIDGVIRDTSAALRQVWAVLDIAKQPTTIISRDEVLDAPMRAGTPEATQEPLTTVGGCTCLPSSTCARRGRPFTWCVVDDKKTCPLKKDFTPRDVMGADHRIAGGALPRIMWDYCIPKSNVEAQPKRDAFAVHDGCKCTIRPSLAEKYIMDPAFVKEDGEFNWEHVPYKDRIALEVLVKKRLLAEGHAAEVTDESAQKTDTDPGASSLCMKVPGSGPHKVCAAEPVDEDAPAGWCARNSWDVCHTKAAVLQEPQEDLVAKEDRRVEDEREQNATAKNDNETARVIDRTEGKPPQPWTERTFDARGGAVTTQWAPIDPSSLAAADLSLAPTLAERQRVRSRTQVQAREAALAFLSVSSTRTRVSARAI